MFPLPSPHHGTVHYLRRIVLVWLALVGGLGVGRRSRLCVGTRPDG